MVGERVHTDLNSLIMNEAVATGGQEGRSSSFHDIKRKRAGMESEKLLHCRSITVNDR